jgi:hypothetical protein
VTSAPQGPGSPITGQPSSTPTPIGSAKTPGTSPSGRAQQPSPSQQPPAAASVSNKHSGGSQTEPPRLIRLDPEQLTELKRNSKFERWVIPILSLVVSLAVAGFTIWHTSVENQKTIDSASKLAQSERDYGQNQMERQFADKVGIVVRSYKDQDFVRVKIANSGSKPISGPRMETSGGRGVTYIRLALVRECEEARFAIPSSWWRSGSYLIFRDGQDRWWRLYEGKPAEASASSGAGEPAANATPYMGPLPKKHRKVDHDSSGNRIFTPYRIEAQVPCS